PAPEPVVLSRNGRQLAYSGETTIRSGAEVKVETARPELSLSLREMDPGAWVIFELPGFKAAREGARKASLAALRASDETAYFAQGDSLWVKLVVTDGSDEAASGFGPRGRTSIEVAR
ncbi:hypothetical protein D2V17_00005, partial [Aurantiacibacter xanthus]